MPVDDENHTVRKLFNDPTNTAWSIRFLVSTVTQIMCYMSHSCMACDLYIMQRVTSVAES